MTKPLNRQVRPTPDQAYDVWARLGDKRSYALAAEMLANRGYTITSTALKGWGIKHGWEARHCAAEAMKEAQRTPHNPDPLSLEASVLAAEMLNRAAIEGAVRAMKEARRIKVSGVADIAGLIEAASAATKAACKARDVLYRLAVWRERIERGDLSLGAAGGGAGKRTKNASENGVDTPYIESKPPSIDLGPVRRAVGGGTPKRPPPGSEPA